MTYCCSLCEMTPKSRKLQLSLMATYTRFQKLEAYIETPMGSFCVLGCCCHTRSWVTVKTHQIMDNFREVQNRLETFLFILAVDLESSV